MFVIASWQPMHFEKFSTGGYWDSFELTDADYMKDPRPAVYELAALLAGTNSSSYTVRFANVHDTQTFYWGARSLFASNSFGAEMCNGFGYGFSYGFRVDAVRTQHVQSDRVCTDTGSRSGGAEASTSTARPTTATTSAAHPRLGIDRTATASSRRVRLPRPRVSDG